MLDETTKSAPAAKSDAKNASGGTSGGGDAAPTSYSRGEGQKLVTRAYRENWLAIFGRPARTTASPKRAKKTPKRKPAAKAKKAAAKTKKKTRRKGRR
jgi:hypothetical protein